jgi:hypothetical protein
MISPLPGFENAARTGSSFHEPNTVSERILDREPLPQNQKGKKKKNTAPFSKYNSLRQKLSMHFAFVG